MARRALIASLAAVLAGCSLTVRSHPDDMRCGLGHDAPNGSFVCDRWEPKP